VPVHSKIINAFGRLLKMKTTIVEVDEAYGEEFKGKYVLQEISWAKRSRIITRYTHYNPQTGRVINIDHVAIQAETLLASLKEQPPSKPITLERFLSEGDNGIPIGLGELLAKAANRLNSIGPDETKNS